MKKIIIALFFLVGTLGFTNVNAQQKPRLKNPQQKQWRRILPWQKKLE